MCRTCTLQRAPASQFMASLSVPAQVMREKVRSHTYVNWQEVVRDFELICANAMKYNQRRRWGQCRGGLETIEGARL